MQQTTRFYTQANYPGVFFGGEIKGAETAQFDPGSYIAYPTGRHLADPVLRLGARATVRAGSILYGGSVIGADLETGHGVVLREQNVIGDHFNVWNNTTIDYGCVIGNNVKIHTNCYIAQFTQIEDDVFMAPGVTIANDPHPGCQFSSQCMRGPTIKAGAKIGVNVTILPMVTIGEGAVIGSGSVVTKDVEPYTVVFGNPARPSKISIYAMRCWTGHTDRPYRPPEVAFSPPPGTIY
jgi:acetyltransferase-like isoleucine patch superfamily enzyme